MRYLTYDEYSDIGGTLEKAAFERVIDRACAIVDLYTQKRLQAEFLISERVKACVRDLCEVIYTATNGEKAHLASRSQSAGGVSESESYTAKTAEELTSEMYGIVYDYLAAEATEGGTPLMYKGVQESVGKLVTKTLKFDFNVKYGRNEMEVPVIVYRE